MKLLKFLVSLLLLASTTSTINSTNSLEQIDYVLLYIREKVNLTTETLQTSEIKEGKITDFPTALWTKTLNFSYTYQYGNKERTINTGKNGNTYLITAEPYISILKKEKMNKNRRKDFKPKQLPISIQGGKFDLDYIHQKLKTKEETFRWKPHNCVVAGISLIFETHEPNQYEALFSFYRKTLKNSSLIYGFISGVSEKAEHDPKAKINQGYESVKTLYDKQPLSPQNLYKNYNKRWNPEKITCPEVIQKLDQATNNEPDNIKNKVINELKKMKTQEPITFHTTAQNAYAHINAGCFGAITDSEQVFLYHAFYTSPEKNKKINRKNNQEESIPTDTKESCLLGYQFNHLLEEYKLYKNNVESVNAAIFRSAFQNENEVIIREKTIQKSEIRQLRPVVGLIIHIHTTRELCQSCAYSLGNELSILDDDNLNEHDKQGILSLKETLQDYNKSNNGLNTEPFITFMVSCGQTIEHDNDQTNDLHPCGVPQSWALEEKLNTQNNNNGTQSNNNTDEDEQKDDNKEEVADSDDKEPFGNKNPFLRNRNNNRINLNLLLATGGYFLQWFCKEQSQD